MTYHFFSFMWQFNHSGRERALAVLSVALLILYVLRCFISSCHSIMELLLLRIIRDNWASARDFGTYPLSEGCGLSAHILTH